MELFWHKGYADTSMADLVEHLGINRFSLYNAYTDKETLYREALNYYLHHISLPALEALKTDEAGVQQIAEFITQFALLQREQKCGCFLQNAILERAHSDANVLQSGDALYKALDEAFVCALNNDVQRGALSDDVNIAQLSRFLVLQTQGIRVLGKAQQYAYLDDALSVLLTTLNSYRLVS